MHLLAEIEKLPVEERLQLVEAIWDSIAREPDQIPVPEWQRSLLRERLEEHRRNPKAGVGWEEVKASLRND